MFKHTSYKKNENPRKLHKLSGGSAPVKKNVEDLHFGDLSLDEPVNMPRSERPPKRTAIKDPKRKAIKFNF